VALLDDEGRLICCCDCGQPAMVEDVIDTTLVAGELTQIVELLCLGCKLARRQRRKPLKPHGL
jgi:hypothetical protein